MNLHIITPWSEQKEFGTAINKAIEQLNPAIDDWIVLKDGDSCFLLPDWGNLVLSVLEKGYDLIGCVTNRVGEKRLVPFSNFEDMDLQSHYNKAKSSLITHGNRVIDYPDDIPGFFMLFSVRIWREIGGFKNSIVFDREFTKAVRMKGGKVGIMPGLYILHCYRLWAVSRDEARKSMYHLIK